jgi:hypothetical protein
MLSATTGYFNLEMVLQHFATPVSDTCQPMDAAGKIIPQRSLIHAFPAGHTVEDVCMKTPIQ